MSLFGSLLSSNLFARITNIGNVLTQASEQLFDEQGNPVDAQGNPVDRQALELAENNHYLFFTLDLEFSPTDKVYLTTASYNFTDGDTTYVSGGGLKNISLISPLTIDDRNTYSVFLTDGDELYSRRLLQNSTNIRVIAKLYVRDLTTNELASIVFFDGLSIEGSTIKNEQGLISILNFATPLDELGKFREKTTSPTNDPADNGYNFVDRLEGSVQLLWGRV